METIVQSFVLSIVTEIVAIPVMANTTQVPVPTLKQVSTSVAQPHIDQQKQVLNSKEAKARKLAIEKVAKVQAKADQKAAVPKGESSKES